MSDTLTHITNVSTIVSIWGATVYSGYRYRSQLRLAARLAVKPIATAARANLTLIVRYIVNPLADLLHRLNVGSMSVASSATKLPLTDMLLVIRAALTREYRSELRTEGADPRTSLHLVISQDIAVPKPRPALGPNPRHQPRRAA